MSETGANEVNREMIADMSTRALLRERAVAPPGPYLDAVCQELEDGREVFPGDCDDAQ
jgi:hypothetical protein